MTKETQAPQGNQFGTFGGVFTPSILTILGVVMFMLTGQVTGQAGIFTALIILIIAKSITTLTGLSISAISTNTRVQGGGAYFLISRSLGPEFGASIGIALFFAQALSVPFYILGFVKALVGTAPQLAPHFMAIGMVTTVGLFIINYVGSHWAIKLQYGILAILLASIVAFLGGGLINFSPETLQANWATGYTDPVKYNFWSVFALFFPAVTGIMAGVNMSGDLKSPEKSIPKGTLYAILVGGLIYGAQIVIMGGALDRQTLINAPYKSLMDNALFGFSWLIVAGVCAATLSSAIGSMMGAPRILQALARDQIFPVLSPFAFGTERGDEPRRGLWLTLVMTLIVLLVAGNGEGDALGAVASILTMFFLFTYGMTNFAAFVEHLSRNPSFRPRFRYFHWMTALLGGVGCFGAAVLINPVAALVALAIIVVIFFYVSRRVLQTAFGDARRGFYYERVRANLKRLSNYPQHAKNWRPTTLVLTGNPKSRLTLTLYANWLAGGSGIITLSRIIEGNIHTHLEERKDALVQLEMFITSNRLSAYADVHVSDEFEHGLSALIQSHSIGPLKPNLIMFGWPESLDRAKWFANHLRLSHELGMSQLCVFDRGLPEKQDRDRRIDVWWRGKTNGSLMVILAYLLGRNYQWNQARIRVLRLATEDQDIEQQRKEIAELINEARLDAEIVIVEGQTIREALLNHSKDASVVFLGFQPPTLDRAEAFHQQYMALTEGLPTTLAISSSGDADLSS